MKIKKYKWLIISIFTIIFLNILSTKSNGAVQEFWFGDDTLNQYNHWQDNSGWAGEKGMPPYNIKNTDQILFCIENGHPLKFSQFSNGVIKFKIQGSNQLSDDYKYLFVAYEWIKKDFKNDKDKQLSIMQRLMWDVLNDAQQSTSVKKLFGINTVLTESYILKDDEIGKFAKDYKKASQEYVEKCMSVFDKAGFKFNNTGSTVTIEPTGTNTYKIGPFNLDFFEYTQYKYKDGGKIKTTEILDKAGIQTIRFKSGTTYISANPVDKNGNSINIKSGENFWLTVDLTGYNINNLKLEVTSGYNKYDGTYYWYKGFYRNTNNEGNYTFRC